jgi:hypothetical protein
MNHDDDSRLRAERTPMPKPERGSLAQPPEASTEESARPMPSP